MRCVNIIVDENILFLINMNNLSDFDDEMICFLINVYYVRSSDFRTDLEVKMKKI